MNFFKMAHTDKEKSQKTSIVMDNFNSTANLATNPGFQSTLSLGTNVISEKDDLYEPFDNREVEHPTSTTGSLVHLLKSSLGSGILAMPAAFKNSGLAVGAVGTLLVGVICTHCVHILVRTSHEVCRVAKRPSMGFAETCGAAFEYGPERLRGWASFAKTFVDYALTATYLGASCVYVVFIAESFKEVIDVYAPESKLTVEMYCALTLVPLVMIGQIRNLKYLVPFSAVANVFLVITFGITLYYMYADTPAPGSRDVVTSFGQLPLFISTVIFAMEGIGVVMPVENEMAKPHHFLGCPGVLNVAMGVVVALYTIVGFFGYLKYGDEVKGSVTLNLPQNEILAQSAKILMALAILFTYGLQFYVPMEIIWRRLRDKIAKKYRNLTQVAIRTFCITASVALAAAFPDLELFIALVGAIFFSTLGLFVPALVETVHRWERGLGKYNCYLWKNCFLIALSFLSLISGSYYSIRNMINKL